MTTPTTQTIKRATLALVVMIAATLAMSTTAWAKGPKRHRGTKVVKTTTVKQGRGATRVVKKTKVVHHNRRTVKTTTVKRRGQGVVRTNKVVRHHGPRHNVRRAPRTATRVRVLPAGARRVRMQGRTLWRHAGTYYKRVVLPGGAVRFQVTWL